MTLHPRPNNITFKIYGGIIPFFCEKYSLFCKKSGQSFKLITQGVFCDGKGKKSWQALSKVSNERHNTTKKRGKFDNR